MNNSKLEELHIRASKSELYIKSKSNSFEIWRRTVMLKKVVTIKEIEEYLQEYEDIRFPL